MNQLVFEKSTSCHHLRCTAKHYIWEGMNAINWTQGRPPYAPVAVRNHRMKPAPLGRPRPRRGRDALIDLSSGIVHSAAPGFERHSDGLEDGLAGDAITGVADEAGDPPAGPKRGAARLTSDAAVPRSRPMNHSEVTTKRPM